MPIGGADHARGLAIPVADAAVERQRVRSEKSLLNVEAGSVVGSTAKTIGLSPGDKRHPSFYGMQVTGFTLGRTCQNQSMFAIETQDGSIGGGAKNPFPVVLVLCGHLSRWKESDGFGQRVEGDVDERTCAGANHDVFDQRRQEGGRGNLYAIAAGGEIDRLIASRLASKGNDRVER